MTIIVTKPCIIIDVVGSYFYEKITKENGLFVLGGPETQLHDILWAVHVFILYASYSALFDCSIIR